MLWKLWRAARALLTGLGLAMVVATATPVDRWWATWLSGAWNDPRGDVLIVLGGSVVGNDTLGQSSYLRALYAVRAWREGRFRQVVVTGEVVAPLMRDFLACQGVPGEAILVENASSSTRENALYTARLLAGAPGRKVLLTSDYHMFRAHRAFTKAGLEVTPAPFPDVRKRCNFFAARWPALLDLVTETSKTGYYFVRGWI
jgi:uncharacterized SAM-binding protein YcdF (DUF218 family)